uniref:Lysozyme inhibitor LprI-like N-terminal domain-containing protein n=1 Tax=Ectopseudomonas mendocina (strain ymp) TaxID=399739 RepID=A4XNH0_ECTM1
MFGVNNKYSFFLLFFTFPALSDAIQKSCEVIEDSQQVAQCAEYAKGQSDKLLNSAYRAALDRIRHQYRQAPLMADQYISLLRGAQREWIKLRDADCKLEAFEIEETAEAYQVTINNCLARMSNDRADYLKHIAPDI